MRNHSLAGERVESVTEVAAATRGISDSSRLVLEECFELFHLTCTGLAKLSIETSNDLFELDPRVTEQEVYEFRSKRGEWLNKFDSALRESFARRLAGKPRTGRRPDAVQSYDALRVMSERDTTKQSALEGVSRRLDEAAKQELEALNCRVCMLLGEPPHTDFDSPFSPAYLLDAIGATSRLLYPESRIWQPLMERIAGDFVPAINKTYLQLNRFLAEHRILPEIGAKLRARSTLRPADDKQLLPLMSRLMNDVHASFQAWRTLDPETAQKVGFELAALPANPYTAEGATAASAEAAPSSDAFPRLDAMLSAGSQAGVLEMLDRWQRADPMDAYLDSVAASGSDAGAIPVNRIPWLQAAVNGQLTGEEGRAALDFVAFLFDYVFHDASIPPRFKAILGGLQIPIAKVALAHRDFFIDDNHPARRFINELAAAAVGADDDEQYAKNLAEVATKIVAIIRAEFVLDTDTFEGACGALQKLRDYWQKHVATATQRYVDSALTDEWRDAHRSRVRVLIRAKLAGVDVPLDVRGFIGTVWAEYMTLLRQARGTQSDDYAAAVKAMDDMLWSIAAKARKGQKARLSKMIPGLVRSLRAGGEAVQASQDRMQRFLSALYDLHIEAIRPDAAERAGGRAAYDLPFANRQIVNLHDFVADLVEGTWLAFDRDGIRVQARLAWISPWRSNYVFSTPSGSEVIVFTPEDLAWEMSNGKISLILEPVTLFDRAVSATLEYLARHSTVRNPHVG